VTTATLLLIDLQNLFYTAKDKEIRIDFEKVWDYFHQRDTEFLTDAIVYMIRGQDFDSSKFEVKLKAIGYSLKIKTPLRLFKNNRPVYKQSNHDVNITVDCMDRINTFDKLILMSGDGDFTDLCSYLKKRGKKIEVWSFKENYNVDLDRYADRVHLIDNELAIKGNEGVSVFGFHYGGPIEG
jgi:uncharacterized LabA/DUF88 family protein